MLLGSFCSIELVKETAVFLFVFVCVRILSSETFFIESSEHEPLLRHHHHGEDILVYFPMQILHKHLREKQQGWISFSFLMFDLNEGCWRQMGK